MKSRAEGSPSVFSCISCHACCLHSHGRATLSHRFTRLGG
ncbi:unnamed protein product [Ciceribacter selenitireducens ATCC BAA-1503]|uniref:Uncharacterized protein n=1 Tax=Ciceribacter selenitireducens ATCC BAA-1503 TaxID=1336235 RepID=A0A376AG91_9HYPH|nr:unnamed protein product [Ciceribacter selenitireducens ATCC BAA-1503]